MRIDHALGGGCRCRAGTATAVLLFGTSNRTLLPTNFAFRTGEDPLHSDSELAWSRLLAAVGEASLLVVIESRMGSRLRAMLQPEDVLQETLSHAWRDRARIEWQGVRAFRRWLIQIAENRIRDAADRGSAHKRGGGRDPVALPVGDEGSSTLDGATPVASTTPSRSASCREHAEAMQAALQDLPDELRPVVALRLFEELELAEVAARLGIGLSACKHRFRKGLGLYQRALGPRLRGGFSGAP